jgi:5,10-methylenetetrahydromethanopterin reductase
MIGGDAERGGIDSVVDEARQAADAGMHTVWMSQIFAFDALTALAVVGREVPGVELGTAVVPTYPRHPAALAMQALTTQAASGGRLVLGIGLSHQLVIENMFGYSFEHPLRHMGEYLSVLLPLVHDGSASFEGKTLKWAGSVQVPGATPFPVLLAALAPGMLRLAGEVAQGTVTWMTGPATIASHIVPSITASAEAAGRGAPRVAVGLPVCVTDDPERARERAAKVFTIYGQLPSYRAMLDREGVAGPADVSVVGDESSVADQLARLEEGGATDFLGAVIGVGEERARTLGLLAELAAR